MKYTAFFCLLFFLCVEHSVAQQPTNMYAFRETVEPLTPIKQHYYLLKNKLPQLPTKLKYSGKGFEYEYIENPAVRYAITFLKTTKERDQKLNNAINTLLEYVDDEEIQGLLAKIRTYTENTQATIAYEYLNNAVVQDSVSNSEDYEYMDGDSTIYYESDMNTLKNYLYNDPNFAFMKKIRCDSVPIEFFNVGDKSIKFWINNGHAQYYRFWALNNGGDSIGTWIQVIPRGSAIKLVLDNGVYQHDGLEIRQPKITKIDNQVEQIGIHEMQIGEIQRRKWIYYWEATLAFGQGYQSNWSGGGENSVSLLNNLKFVANYSKGRLSWENYLHYRLGFLKSSSTSAQKNEELFEVNSKIGEQAFKKWYYTGQLNIQSSFFKTYKYSGEDRTLIGVFGAPTNITLSAGLDYKKKNFSLYLSPIGGKMIWVHDTNRIDQSYYGIADGKKVKSTMGLSVELKNSFTVYKTTKVNNELKIFSSYNDKDYRFNLNWKVDVNMQINYFMQTVVYLYVIYDETYNKNPQFKETLNLALNFRF